MRTEELIRKLEQWIFLPGDSSPEGLTTKEASEIIKGLKELNKLRRLSYRAFKLLEEIVHL